MMRRRELGDTVFAPLADTMTLVACVFLIVCLATAIAFQRSQRKAREALEARNAELVQKNARLAELEAQVRNVDQVSRDAVTSLKAAGVGGVDFVGQVVVLPEGVMFDLGKATLTRNAERVLSALRPGLLEAARRLDGEERKGRIPPGVRFQISGHTDVRLVASGPFRTNWGLSAARATEVLEFILRGVDKPEAQIIARRFVAVGMADTQLLSTAASEGKDPRHRRVEIAIRADVANFAAKRAEP